jgi:hypothetical protein
MRLAWTTLLLVAASCNSGPAVGMVQIPYNAPYLLERPLESGFESHWEVEDRPDGSSPRIEVDEHGDEYFVADRIGRYRLRHLSSLEATSALIARLEVDAVNQPPVVDAVIDGPTMYHVPIEIDASQSYEPNNEPFELRWTVESEAGEAVITPAGLAATLVADGVGVFNVYVVGVDRLGAESERVRLRIEVEQRVEKIQCGAAGGGLSPAHHPAGPHGWEEPRSGVLCVHSVATGTLKAIDALDDASIQVSSDGVRAAVWWGSSVELYSLDPLARIDQFEAGTSVASGGYLVGDHFYYLSGTSRLRRRDLTTGEEVSAGGSSTQLYQLNDVYLYGHRPAGGLDRWRIDVDPPDYQGVVDRTISTGTRPFFYPDGVVETWTGDVLVHTANLATDLEVVAANLSPQLAAVAYDPQRRLIAVEVGQPTNTSRWLYNADTFEAITELRGWYSSSWDDPVMFFDRAGSLFAVSPYSEYESDLTEIPIP